MFHDYGMPTGENGDSCAMMLQRTAERKPGMSCRMIMLFGHPRRWLGI